MPDNYTRKASVERIIDGDTVALTIDLGLYTYVRYSCRLYGINAPELKTQEGKDAKLFLTNLLPVGASVEVILIKPDKFAGRFDGNILYPSATGGRAMCVNDIMIEKGYAVPYFGGPR